MTRRHELALVIALLGLARSAAAATMLTGEVRAVDAQVVETPFSSASPVVLRYYLPEGTRVKPGDVIVRIDPGEAAGALRSTLAGIDQARARAAKDIAGLKVKVVDARIALADAGAALENAKVNAAIPRQVLSALDFDKYHGELERARRELALKTSDLAAASAAVDRRAADAKVEIEKLDAQVAFNRDQISLCEVRADRAGVVLHGFEGRSDAGGRIDEGSSSYPGNKIGEVVGDGPMAVRAWAYESDRAALAVGQPVGLVFDAFPGQPAKGRIVSIGGAPAAKPEWGGGHYFQVDIDLDAATRLRLRPGMSVRVEASSAHAGARP